MTKCYSLSDSNGAVLLESGTIDDWFDALAAQLGTDRALRYWHAWHEGKEKVVIMHLANYYKITMTAEDEICRVRSDGTRYYAAFGEGTLIR